MSRPGLFSNARTGTLLKLELPAQKLYEIWNYNNTEVCFSASGTPVKRLLFGDVNNPCYANPSAAGVHFSLRGYGQYHANQTKPLELWNSLLASNVMTANEKAVLASLIDPDRDIGAYYYENCKVYKGYSSELIGADGEGEQYFLRIKPKDADAIDFDKISAPMVDQLLPLERRGIVTFRRILSVAPPNNSKNLYELFLK